MDKVVPLDAVDDHLIDDMSAGPELFALQQEEYDDLQALLKSLPVLQQKILHLRFAQGMRCAEIAAHLGKREGAIKTMLSRTLNLLKTLYKARGEE